MSIKKENKDEGDSAARLTTASKFNQNGDRFRENRKWQLAYRRFVIEGVPSEKYAPYFGLNRTSLREWFELQLINGLNWGNFGGEWQFEHILPLSYFDFTNESDLSLCWNFINIRVESKITTSNTQPEQAVDLLSAKLYFQTLYKKTDYSIAQKMIQKIESIEANMANIKQEQLLFIQQKKDWLENIILLTKEECAHFNTGVSVEELMMERAILKKFGN
ncbi:MAG: hypothetical protein EAZ35_03970 [Sphingobacteriia bacterium]|nr:MAG: hypothetical protein EAZ35_03970 [Sphingobacteriia bacterium]